MSKPTTIKLSTSKGELKALFEQVILHEIMHDYLTEQRGDSEVKKKNSWYKKLSALFGPEETERMVREATQFLNEYTNWLQLEELDFLASQENEILEEVLAEDDRLDYAGVDIFDRVNRRADVKKKEPLTFKKLIKRKDN